MTSRFALSASSMDLVFFLSKNGSNKPEKKKEKRDLNKEYDMKVKKLAI